MSDYCKKRVDYVNSWPDVKMFEAEYALNYYAFLSAYTVLMLMIINDGDASIEATRYCELYNITKQNKENMELLFGNHLG